MSQDFGKMYEEFMRREKLCHLAYKNDLEELQRQGEELTKKMMRAMQTGKATKSVIKMYAAHIKAMVTLRKYIKHIEELSIMDGED